MVGIPDLKTITSIAKKAFTLEEQAQILSLRDALIESRAENIKLKEELAELRKKADIQARLVWEQPYLFLKDGDKKDGPYCQVCWERDHKLIHLQKSCTCNGLWSCHCCKGSFYDNSYSPPRSSDQQDWNYI